MVKNSDIVLCDLSRAKKASIGCCFEMAWAWTYSKQLIVINPEENIHQHAFVKAASTIEFLNTKDAIEYLDNLYITTYNKSHHIWMNEIAINTFKNLYKDIK